MFLRAITISFVLLLAGCANATIEQPNVCGQHATQARWERDCPLNWERCCEERILHLRGSDLHRLV